MRAYEKEFVIPVGTIKQMGTYTYNHMTNYEVPTRFVVTNNRGGMYQCEVGIIDHPADHTTVSIFSYKEKKFKGQNAFNVVLLIPTGIGATIGGHAGDGNPVARLIAASCDTMITHPNVVNASEINELPHNSLYVEGSILTRLLMGQIGLQQVIANKILLLVDKHDDDFFNDLIVNAVSTARVSLGVDCDVYFMNKVAKGSAHFSPSGRATGEISNLENILNIIKERRCEYDAFALSTAINVPTSYYKDYFGSNLINVNPWGGYEALLTHSIAKLLNVPCAHAPMLTSKAIRDLEYGIVDPRKAPEVLSTTWLYCIIKGLYRSPQIVVPRENGISVDDISCLVIPDKCIGLPTLSCMENGIPVIAVRGNYNIMENDLTQLPFSDGGLIIVNNYLEAAGVLTAMREGISIESVLRPIKETRVI